MAGEEPLKTGRTTEMYLEPKKYGLLSFGPDTPKRGKAKDVHRVFQKSIAATILKLMGLDYQEFRKDAAIPIKTALPDWVPSLDVLPG